MRFIIRLVSALALFLSNSCAHSIHQMYVGSMDPKTTFAQGQWVTAESKVLVILSFQFDTSYVEQAYRELEGKCSGRLAQVSTEHLTSFSFLSYNQKVVLKGLCIKAV